VGEAFSLDIFAAGCRSPRGGNYRFDDRGWKAAPTGIP